MVSIVHRKVNVFMWRTRVGRILTWEALNNKGIDIDTMLCPICGETVENIDHGLVGCSEVKSLWEKGREVVEQLVG